MTEKIGITGHRLPIYNLDYLHSEIYSILLSEKNKNPKVKAISALATGADTVFAKIALELKINLIAIIPMPIEEYLSDFQIDEDKTTLRELWEASETQEIICSKEEFDNNKKSEYYLQTGISIANQCDKLIAAWDGRKENGTGGTAQIVSYYRRLTGKRKLIIIPTYRSELSYQFFLEDEKAIKYKNKLSILWISAIILGLSSAISFSFSTSFNNQIKLKGLSLYFTLFEYIAFISSLFLAYFISKGNIKNRYIRHRKSAEKTRYYHLYSQEVLPITYDDNQTIDIPRHGKHNPIINDQFLANIPIDSREFQSKLENLIDDQLIYHSEFRYLNNKLPLIRLERTQQLLIIIFVIASTLELIGAWNSEQGQFSNHEIYSHLIKFTLMSIPPIIAALEGIMHFKEYRKNLLESEYMIQVLSYYKNEINNIDLEAPNVISALSQLSVEMLYDLEKDNKYWETSLNSKSAPI